MSRNNSKTPYCKVCHDAGKSVSEYTSHWVRTLPDRCGNTKVSCPTLLSTECRYCFNIGHTAKFCPVIKQNKKDKEKVERQEARKAQEETVKIEKVKPAKRGFAVLMSDSSSDSEHEKIEVSSNVSENINIIVEEYPALGTTAKSQVVVHMPSIKPQAKTGWAAALAKPKVVPVEEDRFLAQLEERSMIKNLPQSALKRKAAPVVSKEKDMTKQVYTRDWYDWCQEDTDSDNDEPSAPPMPYNKIVQVAAEDYDSDW